MLSTPSPRTPTDYKGLEIPVSFPYIASVFATGSFTLNIHELWLRPFGGEELVQRKIHVKLAIGQLDDLIYTKAKKEESK